MAEVAWEEGVVFGRESKSAALDADAGSEPTFEVRFGGDRARFRGRLFGEIDLDPVRAWPRRLSSIAGLTLAFFLLEPPEARVGASSEREDLTSVVVGVEELVDEGVDGPSASVGPDVDQRRSVLVRPALTRREEVTRGGVVEVAERVGAVPRDERVRVGRADGCVVGHCCLSWTGSSLQHGRGLERERRSERSPWFPSLPSHVHRDGCDRG